MNPLNRDLSLILLMSLVLSCQANPSEDTGPFDTATEDDSDSVPGDTSSADADTDTDGDGDIDTDTEDALPDPALPGPLEWSVVEASVPQAGGAAVNAHLYIPDGDGPFPVVLFSHGFQLSGANYATYGAHLASWGFVGVLVDLPGGMFNEVVHAELLAILSSVLDWIETSSVTSSSPLEGKVDTTRMAACGHSMGGKLSLWLAATDERLTAVFALDPVDGPPPFTAEDPVDYPSLTPELMEFIDVPLGLMGETTNGTAGAGGVACAPLDDNFHQFFLHAQSPAVEMELLGANHMSFLDDPNCGLPCTMCPSGTDTPSVSLSLARKYMVSFFNVHLAGLEGYDTFLTGSGMTDDVSAGLVLMDTINGY